MNEQLVNQIRTQMTKKNRTLQIKQEGTLHFFVRKGVLQKKFEEDEVHIVNGDFVESKVPDVSLSAEATELLFSLINNAFNAYGQTIEYGHLHINYKINNEGIPVNNVSVRIRREEHYKY
ncbi:hypothetical protein AM501_05345 [Aneurinibacillus migulanus]|uniref:hypothetical protein n=1 Tax=Aneurinibacillus migulanus TaxID=47500 RepID=UPI0005B92196|nr:hypothetical protein [Aneurinibacillus migulanus]KIV58568.1 hypothetical protein TS64_04270 [Aneurinibacillus migulanus]KPD09260.1 hypothetical protein AM501_05345 [Aneurinibacillus migulanus]